MVIKNSWIDYAYIIAIGLLVVLFLNDHINHMQEEESELALMDISLKNQDALKTAQSEIVSNQKTIMDNNQAIINNQEKIISILVNSTR